MSSSPSQLSPANQANITKSLFTPLGQELSYWLGAFENTILPSSSWEHDSLAIWIKISYPLLSPTPSPPPPYSPHTPLSPLSWYLKLYTLVLGGACICVSLTWVGGHAYVLTLTQETDLRIQRYGDCQDHHHHHHHYAGMWISCWAACLFCHWSVWSMGQPIRRGGRFSSLLLLVVVLSFSTGVGSSISSMAWGRGKHQKRWHCSSDNTKTSEIMLQMFETGLCLTFAFCLVMCPVALFYNIMGKRREIAVWNITIL